MNQKHNSYYDCEDDEADILITMTTEPPGESKTQQLLRYPNLKSTELQRQTTITTYCVILKALEHIYINQGTKGFGLI